MRTFQQVSALRAFTRAAREDGKTVGFVPTMGALHEGHISLIRRARGDCDVVITSIFVNPTQFAAGEDFEKYPRDLSRDSRSAQQAGVDALFSPSVEEMYPAGNQTTVEVPYLARNWEGQARPGHFSGVATVCTKLFHIVNPNRVYFGQKDFQQLRILERMVDDLHLPLTVVAVPTVREPDGLALSSRNAYLSSEERQAATSLSKALRAVETAFAGGERSGEALERVLREVLLSEPRVQIEYAAIADVDTLEPLPLLESHGVALLAVQVGTTRLIDNTLLGITLAKL
jgi:pantoate--beta-alanine ligase